MSFKRCFSLIDLNIPLEIQGFLDTYKFRLDRDALSKGACLLLIPFNVEIILALLSFTALVTKLQESTVAVSARYPASLNLE